MQPRILAKLSNAGGVGKTTLAVNLAYEASLRGHSVGIIDLDQNHSIEEFVGTEPQQDPTKTSLALFDSNFKGDYPFISPILGTDKIGLIQGHPDIEHLKEVLSKKRRREYILQKIFSSYPLNFDLIIIDLPGGYDILTENVVVASTDILIPVNVGVKTFSVPDLVERILQSFEELELTPPPKILGLLPNQYDNKSSSDRMVLKALKDVAKELKLKIYPAIRYWLNLKRAAIEGKSLKQLRSTDSMNIIFSEIIDDIFSK